MVHPDAVGGIILLILLLVLDDHREGDDSPVPQNHLIHMALGHVLLKLSPDEVAVLAHRAVVGNPRSRRLMACYLASGGLLFEDVRGSR